MTKFVNNNKKFLQYFHKSEKHLERVGPELNLIPEYYNCMNVRLVCFNRSITVYIIIYMYKYYVYQVIEISINR